jgi:hypothetical protein
MTCTADVLVLDAQRSAQARCEQEDCFNQRTEQELMNLEALKSDGTLQPPREPKSNKRIKARSTLRPGGVEEILRKSSPYELEKSPNRVATWANEASSFLPEFLPHAAKATQNVTTEVPVVRELGPPRETAGGATNRSCHGGKSPLPLSTRQRILGSMSRSGHLSTNSSYISSFRRSTFGEEYADRLGVLIALESAILSTVCDPDVSLRPLMQADYESATKVS